MSQARAPGRLDGLPPAGLCGSCAHALLNRTRRGPVYLRCGAASSDDRLPRYPRLPVVACPAHLPLADDSPADGRA
ncbi:hypothetical protein DT076_05410 [Desertihabitans brevis]|uniref:Uncharacterized protein n=1 Tax=Desertihabitans brevis TaxID=2268447 RepID=A0A367YY50_9ACTN|nr:hypothetical protein DT076_05410 [Desertihabitans brevis]